MIVSKSYEMKYGDLLGPFWKCIKNVMWIHWEFDVNIYGHIHNQGTQKENLTKKIVKDFLGF